MTQKKPTYWELLKHPKWQEKRLRIMEQSGFSCERCGDKNTTLNVHHSYYERGCDPWDYPDESLHCLCEPCHEIVEGIRRDINRQIGRLAEHQWLELLGFARGLELEEWPNRSHSAESIEVVKGMVRVFLTLSGHQTNPIVEPLCRILSNSTNPELSGSDLFDACDCDRLADAAKGVPFELIP